MIHIHCYHATGKEEDRTKQRRRWFGCNYFSNLFVEQKCCICTKLRWKRWEFKL